uniref:Actin-bundling protein n=1 Tax=Acrobeloides nanus TaxID=290746 RepID=A0A914DWY5_9BILA
MSNEYGSVKKGVLKLKGNKTLFKADRKTVKKETKQKSTDPDKEEHGGWWRMSEESDLKGGIDISIESVAHPRAYIAALDNGKFILGAPHFNPGEPPNPEEIFTLIKTPDDPKMSFKTGYGKFIGVDAQGQLIATADAIGARERFEAVFQEGKSAMQSSSSGLFLSFNMDREGYVYVSSKKATESEMLNFRTNSEKTGPVDWRSAEDKKSAGDCETAYIKKFIHSKVDTKNRMLSYDPKDKEAVRLAQEKGTLHETLLDRRAKLKSDKYC